MDTDEIGEKFAQLAQDEVEKLKKEGQSAIEKIKKEGGDAYEAVLTDSKKFDRDQREKIESLFLSASTYQREQRELIDKKLEAIEEKVAKDFKGKLLAIVTTIVALAGGVAIAGFQTVSHQVNASIHEVNNDVRQLQTSTIAARDRIEKSSGELVEATNKVKSASHDLDTVKRNYEAAASQLEAARQQYLNLVKQVNTIPK
jgi:chromosome segregation ATPase